MNFLARVCSLSLFISGSVSFSLFTFIRSRFWNDLVAPSLMMITYSLTEQTSWRTLAHLKPIVFILGLINLAKVNPSQAIVHTGKALHESLKSHWQSDGQTKKFGEGKKRLALNYFFVRRIFWWVGSYHVIYYHHHHLNFYVPTSWVSLWDIFPFCLI